MKRKNTVFPVGNTALFRSQLHTVHPKIRGMFWKYPNNFTQPLLSMDNDSNHFLFA
ncbi:hypothetical protein HanPSC8_Chr01g0042241 [Helianthus annuus]|nr:hypothetical protein HanPSC8_Chr01g0042241 [Helianthus annuus]